MEPEILLEQKNVVAILLVYVLEQESVV